MVTDTQLPTPSRTWAQRALGQVLFLPGERAPGEVPDQAASQKLA
jgi:hypothetical protein